MDALLQIIIPKLKETEGISVVQPVYDFDGVEYPQDSRHVSWQDLSLRSDQETEWLMPLLPSNFPTEDLEWFKVPDETLDNYDISVKREPEFEGERPLETFLRLLLGNHDVWIIAFIMHYDQVDGVYKLSLEEAIARLRSNLSGDSASEGFIAYKQ